jgi:predicted membrane-bound spermidine synthase
MFPFAVIGTALAGGGLLTMFLAFSQAVGFGAYVGRPVAIPAAPDVVMTVVGFFATVAGVILLAFALFSRRR